MKYYVTVEEHTFEIEITSGERVWVGRRPLNVDLKGIDGLPLYSLLIDNRSYEAHVEAEGDGECQVVVSGRPYRARLEVPAQGVRGDATRHVEPGPAEVTAPLPGLVTETRVAEGEVVQKGDIVVMLESMKMQMELRAPRAGIVQSLPARAGREVGLGEVLVVIRPDGTG